MQELYLRLGQGTALTYGQQDENFKRLKAAIDALEVSVAGAGLGTVTSVGLSLPNIFTVSGSPVTTTGSLTATLASQSQNRFFASPNGASGQPTFRSIVLNDLPTIPYTKGGTGLTSAAANTLLVGNGTGYTAKTITSASAGLTITQNPTDVTFALNLGSISLTSLGGVLGSNQGGTGVTSASNGQLLIGNGTGFSLSTITAGSGISIVNGSGTVTISASGAGVASLNGLTGALTATTGTTGTDFNITTPSSTEVRFNFPNASGTNRGLLTSADWTSFNNKLNGSGTVNRIPIFNGINSISNSLLTYSSAFSTGQIEFASGESGARIRSVGTVSSEVDAFLSASAFTRIYAQAGDSGTVFPSSVPYKFLQGTTERGGFSSIGVFYAENGMAVNGFTYYNILGGSSTSIPNNGYGVIISGSTASSVSVALPPAPLNGQEVVVAVEASRTITVTSSKTIYGHNAGVNIPLTLTGGSAGAATLILKYAALGNAGNGAWYITGL